MKRRVYLTVDVVSDLPTWELLLRLDNQPLVEGVMVGAHSTLESLMQCDYCAEPDEEESNG